MPIYMIEYAYDGRTEERMSHRPDHLNYLNGLVDKGVMLAFGRFDDDGEPGALLMVKAESPDAVEEVVHLDPYVVAGLVPSHRVRRWAGVWGAKP
jgi:uncharacterized protein YciI